MPPEVMAERGPVAAAQTRALPATPALSARNFERVSALFQNVSGIRLTAAKHALVVTRLARLAGEAGESDLDRYVERLLAGALPPAETTRVVDRLTTNETYFFREPEHFRHFAELLERHPERPWRVWSGASSSGEEIYSLAMLMADRLGQGDHRWSVLGTDLSTAMVEQGRRALYPAGRTNGIPGPYLKRYCLKGTGEHEGRLLVAGALRQRTRFETLNLMQPLPAGHGPFDAIWLRNVLIYFDVEAKTAIVRRVLQALAPHGVLYTGHAESLVSLGLPIRGLAPAVYVHA
jgi:chemotaxis protein methyltransferase CheR